MKARDVLIAAGSPWRVDAVVAALLAATPEGEGVYIAPDGTLGRVERTWWCNYGDDRHYRLVPIEEATDD